MTTQELANLTLHYLTGKKSELYPFDKEEAVTSVNNIGASRQQFIDDMEKQVIDEYDAETRIGVVQEEFSYDVTYSFGHESAQDDVAIIIGMTDVLRTTYKKGDEFPTTELLYRKVDAVTIEEKGIATGIALDSIKEYLYDYAAIHERVYDAFNTKNWKYVFKWEALPNFINQQHDEWDKYKENSEREKGASLPPFAKFHKDTRKQLKKFLQDGKSENFILQFVEESLDTAHLYGMNEKRK